jgi:hypothetical protein
MKRVEERLGFTILLEEPPPTRSLWAALAKPVDLGLYAELEQTVKVCLACTRESALADARAFVDDVASRRSYLPRIRSGTSHRQKTAG